MLLNMKRIMKNLFFYQYFIKKIQQYSKFIECIRNTARDVERYFNSRWKSMKNYDKSVKPILEIFIRYISNSFNNFNL